ncbi:hypothetical protein CCACVL1_29108 [Corchorus capsularis]|uniref:Uncharacterized protein n=1 Tax=Corchorus capsularis TaxID=210143 RepID=A0A1R3G3R5_COCAP|nr:hypothetical protein CCACVL1_29108 [Corchorus capsularis]
MACCYADDIVRLKHLYSNKGSEMLSKGCSFLSHRAVAHPSLLRCGISKSWGTEPCCKK